MLVGTVLPTISLNYDYLLLVVAVLGTTMTLTAMARALDEIGPRLISSGLPFEQRY